MPDSTEMDTTLDDRLRAIQQRADVSKSPQLAVVQEVKRYQAAPRPVELLSWSSDSRVYDPKSPQWFLGLFALGIVGVIGFAVLREVTLILVVIAIIFVYYALARVEPVEVEHTILNTGVKSGGRMYLWRELRSFWIYEHQRGDTSIVRLDTSLHFPHTLELLLSDVSPEAVEEILLQYLPQQEKALSESGAMADQALLSVANKLPYRDKLLGWVETHTGYIHFNQPDEPQPKQD
jgi:hypothetical protein